MNMPVLMMTLLSLALAACGGDAGAGADPATAAASAEAAPAAAASRGDDALEGLVLRYAPGGAKPEAFCVPEWSIANQTAQDLPGLLVQIAWHHRDGRVILPAGESGSLFENLRSGERRDRTLNGEAMRCADLRIVVSRYACRDENAVRIPCPGPLKVRVEGGIEADTSEMQEGPLRGAMES